MNESRCMLADSQHEVRFPDIPPVELCRRHSCLDNFILSGCIGKASDNLARLDEILGRRRLADSVKRSYRRSATPDEPAERRDTTTARLLADGRPRSGRLAEDVHALLENLGTLVRRLEVDINRAWTRSVQLEAATARAHREQRRTSSGFQLRLRATVSQLCNSWNCERKLLERETEQTRRQGDQMAAVLDALQQRVGDIGDYVVQLRTDGATAGAEARTMFEEIRELKRQLRERTSERREEQRRLSIVHEVAEKQRSAVEVHTLQRSVRRRSIRQQLQVMTRDASAATSQQSVLQQRLQEAVQESVDAETQVTASLSGISEQLQPADLESSESALVVVPEAEPADILYVTLRDAVTQMERRLIQMRHKAVRVEIACRDEAQQIGKLHVARESLRREKKQLVVEIKGIKIQRECSSHQIRRNVNMITVRCIEMRKKIQDNIAKHLESQKATDKTQPGVFRLKDEVKELKVALRSAKQEELPLMTKLVSKRAKYKSEEDGHERRVSKARAEYEYQSEVRRDLEQRLIGVQKQLMQKLAGYELTMEDRDALEEGVQQRQTDALPALWQLRAQNNRGLLRLAETASARSEDEQFIDAHGAALMTATAAAAFALQKQEAQMFHVEQQLERISAALAQSHDTAGRHREHLRRLRPEAAQLTVDIQCLESERLFLLDTCQDRDNELQDLSRLVVDWERIKRDYRDKHDHYLREAHRRTGALRERYDRAVLLNIELREKYSWCVQRWLAERELMIPRMQPQLVFKAQLLNQIQVVRLVSAGVARTDHGLSLRHLYFSGELHRGQSQLAELYERVCHLRGDMSLACERVVREFIGLMKGELPFVLQPEPETDLREAGVQTDDGQMKAVEQRERQRCRLERRRRLLMNIAELGSGEPSPERLPPVRRNAERPVTGTGKLHRDVTKLPRI